MSMKKAIETLAEHLARKMAKKKGTSSEHYIQGATDMAIFCAKNPLPPGADMIAALQDATDSLPDKPTEP